MCYSISLLGLSKIIILTTKYNNIFFKNGFVNVKKLIVFELTINIVLLFVCR